MSNPRRRSAEFLRRSRAAKKGWKKRQQSKPKTVRKTPEPKRSRAAKAAWKRRKHAARLSELEKKLLEQGLYIERLEARVRVKEQIEAWKEDFRVRQEIKTNVTKALEDDPQLVKESIRNMLRKAKEEGPEAVKMQVMMLSFEFTAMELAYEYDEGEIWAIYKEGV